MRLFRNKFSMTASAAAVAMAAMSTPVLAQEQTYNFSIPSQDMRTSLRSFSRVTGHQIAFKGSQVSGKRAPALNGSFGAREGLRRLLVGSGLNATWGKTGIIMVRPMAPAPQTASYVQQTPPPAPVAEPAAAPVEDVAAEAEQAPEIVVTGSRIQRQLATDAPTPVVTIGTEDIQASGATELSEILLDYPAVTTETSLTNSTNAINAAGLSTVSLRDLGADRTLTLIDGRRAVSNSMSGNRVSLSTIPAMFVDRMEVITGGASAVYGSDAIAGVVNVITIKDYDGLKLGGRAGISSQGDTPRYNLDALWGTKLLNDNVSIVLGASYENEGGVMARQRARSLMPISYAQTADLDPNNQGDLGITYTNFSSATPSGRFLSSSGAGYFVYDDNGNLYRSTDVAEYGYNSRWNAQLSAPRETWMVAGKASAKLGSNVEFFASAQYSDVSTKAFRGYESATHSETYGLLDEFTVGRIPRNNPYVPAAIRAAASSSGIQWSRRFVELGTYGTENDRRTFRGWTGFRGELGSKWNWEVSYGYGRFKQDQARIGGINAEALHFALNAEYDPAAPGDLSRVRCIDATARANGCVPINLFGAGSISQAAADYIRADIDLVALVKQNVAQAFISGELIELPAGPVALALGAEYRKDWQRTVTDDLTRRGLATPSFIAEYEGNIKAKEAFAELSIPLLKDQPFAHELTIDGAARLGDYNIKNVGNVFSYRVGGGWAPTEGLKFRAQYATAQRAPTITNLYSPMRDDSDSVTDPCNGVTASTNSIIATNCRSVASVAAQIANLGVFTQDSRSIKGPNAGNPNLKEETATTLTAGVVFTPRFIPGLSFTADYFNIKIKDAIGSLSADELAQECYARNEPVDTNVFCEPITRDSDGQITRIVNQDLNLNNITRAGYDIGVDYRFAAPEFLSEEGKFDVRLLYSRNLKFNSEFNGVNGVTRLEALGQPGAWKNVGQMQLGYREGGLRLRWKAKYTGKAVDSLLRAAVAEAAGSKPPFLYLGDRIRHDFYASFDIEDKGPEMRFYLGVNNAFNSVSPFLPSGTNTGSSTNYSGFYDVTGRYFYTGFEAKF